MPMLIFFITKLLISSFIHLLIGDETLVHTHPVPVVGLLVDTQGANSYGWQDVLVRWQFPLVVADDIVGVVVAGGVGDYGEADAGDDEDEERPGDWEVDVVG